MEFKLVGCEDADKLDLFDIFDRKFFLIYYCTKHWSHVYKLRFSVQAIFPELAGLTH